MALDFAKQHFKKDGFTPILETVKWNQKLTKDQIKNAKVGIPPTVKTILNKSRDFPMSRKDIKKIQNVVLQGTAYNNYGDTRSVSTVYLKKK